jgi:DNA-binding NarL/FixJ family response regulator
MSDQNFSREFDQSCFPGETGFPNPDREIERLVREFCDIWKLSPRQACLVELAVTGQHRKEAAHRLACSLKTVEGYWKRIYEKTQCQSQAEVVSKFIHHAFETDNLLFHESLPPQAA